MCLVRRRTPTEMKPPYCEAIVFLFVIFSISAAQTVDTTTLKCSSNSRRELAEIGEDFEGIFPNSKWYEESEEGGYRWAQESDDEPCEKDNPVPNPLKGNHHLRLWRCDVPACHFGVAKLHSRNFVAFPGDKLVFTYWIRSRYLHFTNLQISYRIGMKEQILAEFHMDSTPGNAEWRTASLLIPIETETELALIIYGFCGDDLISSIAIDDIAILPTGNSGCNTEETISSSTAVYDVTTSSITNTVTITNRPTLTMETSSPPPMTTSPITTTAETIEACSDGEDYGPYCVSKGCVLKCDSAPSLSHLKNSLSELKVKTRFNGAELQFTNNDSMVPENIFGDHIITNVITIDCPAIRPHPFAVHYDAFSSVATSLEKFYIVGCNLQGTNFSFLGGLTLVKVTSIEQCTNIHLSGFAATFPALPNLISLVILESQGMSEMMDFPSLAYLENFSMTGNQIGDELMSFIFDKIFECCAETLDNFDVSKNVLTRIPSQISLFKNLIVFTISSNHISVLQSKSILLNMKLNSILLDGNGMSTIEPGAFEGNLQQGIQQCDLSDNNLTRFESAVFQHLLEQMGRYGGLLKVKGNPFSCYTDVCHLAWLLRDNRHFLEVIDGARCEDRGIDFEDIDEGVFSECPASNKSAATIST